jgi:uncharacterized protein YbcC (UPF0753/DUF2309 family)
VTEITTHLRESISTSRKSQEARLREALEYAGNLLPIQGPISAFVFLNHLMAFENLPWEQGLRLGRRLFRCEPYQSENQYRESLTRGRIQPGDLVAELKNDLGEAGNEPLGPLGTRYDLRLAMLQYPLQIGPAQELRWFVAETDALTRLRSEITPAMRERFVDATKHWVMRDLHDGAGQRTHHLRGDAHVGAAGQAGGQDSNGSRGGSHGENGSSGTAHDQPNPFLVADLMERYGESSIESWTAEKWESFSLKVLWRVCREGVQGLPPPTPIDPPAIRHRDLLLTATGEDSDQLVNGMLVRFCAAYSDQGFARWSLPNRDDGFYASFCELYRSPGGPPDSWLKGLSLELSRQHDANMTPAESVFESLELLGVPEEEWRDYVTASIIALRGWVSLLHHMVVRGDRVPLPAPVGTLEGYLAVRLILERLALKFVASDQFGYRGTLANLRDELRSKLRGKEHENVEQRAFSVFQLAQVLDWNPQKLLQLSKADWGKLTSEIEAFDNLKRRSVFHLAFERRFRIQTLDAISIFTRRPVEKRKTPKFQISCCIDTREESFRRHLEEMEPDAETFAAAGFYGVAMYFRGAADAHYQSLCPIVVTPKHWVTEEVLYTFEDTHRRRAKTRRALGSAAHGMHVGSRSIAAGALLTAGFGVLASIPLVTRVLFPRFTSKLRKSAQRFVEPPPVTRMRIERIAETPGPTGDHIGFSLEEMAFMGEKLLREMGAVEYSRLFILLGHGSFCLNNPHKSAYDCGACCGVGAPNARAMALILNDPRVRAILRERGVVIPDTTVFLGGLHNTGTDRVTYADLDLLPASHRADFEYARDVLDKVCEVNAHERCRRFQSAPFNLSFPAARMHAEARTEDLAQTRPEFGNASNAISYVGRRSRIRGLYLDRRAFQTSYDPTSDFDDSFILARMLSAVVPVCEGINLQYYFSRVDSPGFGSGTKLPHNPTALLGVMDGAASDMRAGLPWQSVEIHEPLRCLFVIEATPETMLKIMDGNEAIGHIFRNGWAILTVLDPHSSEIKVFQNGQFHVYEPEAEELPVAPTSTDWYRGWRDHLGFAIIEKV